MKALKYYLQMFVIGLVIFSSTVQANAQDDTSASFDAGADIVSSYVWRGVKFGTGPQIQPWLSFTAGNFEIGSWGSFGSDVDDSGNLTSFGEADLYLSYGFDFGLSVGLTDYYYPGSNWSEFSTLTDSTGGAHGFELNLGYEIGGFSIGANYMLNQAFDAGTAGGDMYFELGYSWDAVGIFVGAGDGWHTSDGEFGLCNVGLSYSKEVAITEKFALPISGSVILNPEADQYYVVVGVSF